MVKILTKHVRNPFNWLLAERGAMFLLLTRSTPRRTHVRPIMLCTDTPTLTHVRPHVYKSQWEYFGWDNALWEHFCGWYSVSRHLWPIRDQIVMTSQHLADVGGAIPRGRQARQRGSVVLQWCKRIHEGRYTLSLSLFLSSSKFWYFSSNIMSTESSSHEPYVPSDHDDTPTSKNELSNIEDENYE